MFPTRALVVLAVGLTASASHGFNPSRRSQAILAMPNKPPLNETYPEQWFEQPLDHFTNTGHTFQQRFWFSDKHYAPGGPIYVLDGGETSGEDRLPFLDTGIVNILANATGGFGIVLEHRYYGQSIPVDNFTTDSLRWLDNDQAAADSANFIRNYKLNGTPLVDAGPVIYYGGSYAGARSAHMRVLYPDLVFGAIASSAVVHAQYSMPEYAEVIRKAAPKECVRHVENSIILVDRFLSISVLRNATKMLFGLQDLDDEDFVQTLSNSIGAWQSLVWDPEESSTAFFDFCRTMDEDPGRGLQDFFGEKVDFSFLNYAKWIRETVIDRCEGPIPECVLTNFTDVSLNATWRPWIYQTCTQWGYYQSAPRDPSYPSIISRLITADKSHFQCFELFPPGEFNSIPRRPNVSAVNDLGDFGLTADRLAFIDGEVDPWRPMTPHSQYARPREDTLNRPFKLIPGAVHHWDEYGLANLSDEPPEIFAIHMQMIEFVRHWLKEWKSTQTRV